MLGPVLTSTRTFLSLAPCLSFYLACLEYIRVSVPLSDRPSKRGRLLRHVKNEEYADGYQCVRFHPDGLILGTGTGDALVRIWDMKQAVSFVLHRTCTLQHTRRLGRCYGNHVVCHALPKCVSRLWFVLLIQNTSCVFCFFSLNVKRYGWTIRDLRFHPRSLVLSPCWGFITGCALLLVEFRPVSVTYSITVQPHGFCGRTEQNRELHLVHDSKPGPSFQNIVVTPHGL